MRWFVVALILLAPGAPISAEPPAPEPVQDRKPLGRWVKALEYPSADARAAAAAAAIGKMGSNAKSAVPALLARLKDKDAKVAGKRPKPCTTSVSYTHLTLPTNREV